MIHQNHEEIDQDQCLDKGGGRNVRSSEWNAVPDLIMEDKDGVMITEADTKQKRDEVAQG